MGHAIFDLERVLVSKVEQLTDKEAKIILQWRDTAIRDFSTGFFSGSVLTWLATKRLRTLYRVNLAVSGATAYGFYRFRQSVERTVGQILTLEGSLIQSEMANIMLKNYQNDPWVARYLSKRFYSEEVYDDSSVDKSSLRWRFRNFSGDPITHSHNTFYSNETDSKENDVKNTTVQPKQVHVNGDGDTKEDPFDLVFGFREIAEVAPNPDSPITPTRKSKLKEKRMRRRHRRHHHEEEDLDI